MKAVLDASALLAFLQSEPGADTVEAVLHDGAISTVNWSEVLQKALASGVPIEGMRADLEALGLTIVPFTAVHASAATCDASRLFTEDFAARRILEGVGIENSFSR